MSGPFTRNELIVCVDASVNAADPKAALLTEGRVYRVGTCGQREDLVWAVAFHCLRIPGQPGKGWAFSATRFRSINDEPDNAALVAQIRACKPIRVGEPA